VNIATRGSALALTQAQWVAGQLPGEHELVTVTTSGDRGEGPSDKARWVDAVERALLDGEADLAVHRAKDVPAQLAPGTVLLGSPVREDPRDAMIVGPGAGLCHEIAELREGARVGTSSLRRRAQLLALRPDLEIVELRGNVDTRLRKLAEGEVDAAIIAAAGLLRMGWQERISEYLPVEAFVPSPGQGALGIECRADDRATLALLAHVADRPVTIAVGAERAFLRAVGGGCQSPIGAHAVIEGDTLTLHAMLADEAMTVACFQSASGGLDEADTIARQLAESLRDELALRLSRLAS
jgi:hydroxymethylbilane synthase